MTMPPPVNVIVGETLDSVQAIRAYTRGLAREEFTARPMVQDAVLRRFEILGEAAKSLPPSGGSSTPKCRGGGSSTRATGSSTATLR